MPRAGWARPETDQRLSDHLSIAMLTRVYPPTLIDDVITVTGRGEQRQRLLSARVVLYYVLALALFAESSYEEVMRHLLEGLAWQEQWAFPWQLPTKAAIFKSRTRLGVEPLVELYRRAIRPLGPPVARYRAWQLVTLDDAWIDVAGTPANAAAVGRPEAAPQFRMMGLVEQATQVIIDLAIAPAETETPPLQPILERSLHAGMLCSADGQLADFGLWEEARKQGAELLWRPHDGTASTAALTAAPTPIETLPDGSYLAHLPGAGGRDGGPVVRVLDVPDTGADGTDGRHLFTSLLDPAVAPASDLISLHSGRTRLDATLDELKTHQRAPRLVLRSKSPDLVLQELYGMVLVHFAIRSLLGQPAGFA